MKGFAKAALLAALFMELSGCSSVVKLNVKHAPEVELGVVRTLGVERFSVSGRVNLDVADDGNAWRNMMKNTVAGSLLAPSDENVQKAQYAGLVEALQRNGYFQVSTGLADARLSGHVDYRVNDRVSVKERKLTEKEKREIAEEEQRKRAEEEKRKRAYEERREHAYGERHERTYEEPPRYDEVEQVKRTYTLTRNVEATLHFMATDARGIVLGSSQVEHGSEKSWTGDSLDKVRKQARESDVSSEVMDEIAAANRLLVKKIAPHYVLESRVLEECDSDRSDEGNQAAEDGRWLAAAEHWQAMSRSSDAECRHAAEYNLGVFDESQGRLGEALMRFENAYAFTHNAKFSADAERIRQRMQEEERMRQIEAQRQQFAPL